MAIKKIKRVKVSEAVLEQMRQLILDGTWKPGDQLASEMELADMFGVSRISVRAAIQRLIGMGILNVRQGDGTYIAERMDNMLDSQMMRMFMTRPQLREVLEFRLIIESGSAALAAQNATSEDIAKLRECEQQLVECGDVVEDFAYADIAYHRALAAASHNSLIVHWMDMFGELYENAMVESIRLRGVEAGRYNHTPITDAIFEHNKSLAEELIRKHIRLVIQRLDCADTSL